MAKARPCDVTWIRSLVQQCQAAHVPVFAKQMGSNSVSDLYRDESGTVYPTGDFQRIAFRHPKGGDPAEWPDDLRIRQWPEVRA